MALSWPYRALASAVIFFLVWQAYVLTGFRKEEIFSIASKLQASTSSSSSSSSSSSPSFFSTSSSPSQALYLHGNGNCAGIQVTQELINNATRIRKSCEHSPPPFQSLGGSSSSSSPAPRIATLSAFFSDSDDPDTHYQMALQTHLLRTLVHRSSMHVLCAPIIDGMWNKQALILSVMLQEMEKPPQDRLEWIFWADGDTVVLDKCRDPLTFIQPPTERPGFDRDGYQIDTRIDLVIAKDHNGLNAGVFLARTRGRPPLVEQTAMDNLLQEEKYSAKVKYVPQHWFNAYGREEGIVDEFLNRDNTTDLPEWAARRGDFMIHFAGCSDKAGEMMSYANASRELDNVWESGDTLRDIGADISAYWAADGDGADTDGDTE